MSALEIDGCRIHLVVEGPPEAPAVVFTHGAMLDHTSWAPQAEALARRYRVVRWDLPGHGQSQPLGRFERDSGGRALLGIMDHLELERAALVGLSVGGWIAQWVAQEAPERVRALACFGTTSISEPTFPGVALRGLRASAGLTAALPFGLLRRALPRVLARTAGARAHALAKAEATRREDFLRFWRGASHLIDPDPDAGCRPPLLIAHGEHDLVARIPKYARRWSERCPEAQLAVIPGAGHLANLDAPDATTAVLERFLRAHAPAGGEASETAPAGM
jgi:pimeloyl-ACP methyl ester carboxylesterase